MKKLTSKIFYTVLILCALSGVAATARAARPVFGVAAGVTGSSAFRGNDMVFDVGIGATAGGIVRWDLPRNFSIETGLSAYYRSWRSADAFASYENVPHLRGDARVEFGGLAVPVYAGYTFPELIGYMDLTILAGPELNFNFAATATSDDLPREVLRRYSLGKDGILDRWGVPFDIGLRFGDGRFFGMFMVGIFLNDVASRAPRRLDAMHFFGSVGYFFSAK